MMTKKNKVELSSQSDERQFNLICFTKYALIYLAFYAL